MILEITTKTEYLVQAHVLSFKLGRETNKMEIKVEENHGSATDVSIDNVESVITRDYDGSFIGQYPAVNSKPKTGGCQDV